MHNQTFLSLLCAKGMQTFALNHEKLVISTRLEKINGEIRFLMEENTYLQNMKDGRWFGKTRGLPK